MQLERLVDPRVAVEHVHRCGGLAIGGGGDEPHVAGAFGRAVRLRQQDDVSGPSYQPSNGGISHTASAVNNSTSLSMS